MKGLDNAGDRRNGILVIMAGMCPTGPHMLVRFILMCFREQLRLPRRAIADRSELPN